MTKSLRQLIPFERYVEYRKAGLTQGQIADKYGISSSRITNLGYNTKYQKLIDDETYGCKPAGVNRRDYTREDVLAIFERINKARLAVIERYGSVMKAPDDCLEIKMLQQQTQSLPTH